MRLLPTRTEMVSPSPVERTEAALAGEPTTNISKATNVGLIAKATAKPTNRGRKVS